jgi:hypothetical protein
VGVAVVVPVLLAGVPIVALLLVKRGKRRKGRTGGTVDVTKITSADLGELQPDVRQKAEAVLAEMRAQGFDPRVYETFRSPERADYLMQKGVSKAGRASYHVKRRAYDVVNNALDSRGDRILWGASTGKGNDAERKAAADSFFQAFGRAVKKHGGTWGGDWSFYDPAHAQW